ncbi:MAG: metal-dependent transcriptional regulator [Chloroflexi bacterium]|nr:metal-dependent transcriptional regulator [Chloroflexota bacterium]
MLKVDLSTVHIEAHRLEHAISDDVETRINEMLGMPKTCPFGFPIPGNGSSRRHPRTLGQVTEGERWTVDRVPEEDSRFLGYLISNSVLPGAVVVVQEVAPYKGTLTLILNERPVVIGLGVAGGIRVRRD